MPTHAGLGRTSAELKEAQAGDHSDPTRRVRGQVQLTQSLISQLCLPALHSENSFMSTRVLRVNALRHCKHKCVLVFDLSELTARLERSRGRTRDLDLVNAIRSLDDNSVLVLHVRWLVCLSACLAHGWPAGAFRAACASQPGSLAWRAGAKPVQSLCASAVHCRCQARQLGHARNARTARQLAVVVARHGRFSRQGAVGWIY